MDLNEYVSSRQNWFLYESNNLKFKIPWKVESNELRSYVNIYLLENRVRFEKFLFEQGEWLLDSFVKVFMNNQWRWKTSPFHKSLRTKLDINNPKHEFVKVQDHDSSYVELEFDELPEYQERELKLQFLEVAHSIMFYHDKILYQAIFLDRIQQKEFSKKYGVNPAWTSQRVKTLKKNLNESERLYRMADPNWKSVLLRNPDDEGRTSVNFQRLDRAAQPGT